MSAFGFMSGTPEQHARRMDINEASMLEHLKEVDSALKAGACSRVFDAMNGATTAYGRFLESAIYARDTERSSRVFAEWDRRSEKYYDHCISATRREGQTLNGLRRRQKK